MNRIIVLLTILFTIFLPLLISADSLPPETVEPVTDSIVEPTTADESAASILKSEEAKAERIDLLISYSRFRNIWRFVSFFVSLLILFIIIRTGLSTYLRSLSMKIKLKFFEVWVYFILFILVYYLIDFPFSFYSGFLVEGEFGFVTQSFGQWLYNDIISLGISMIFGIIPVWFLYALINEHKKWWLYFGLGSIPFVLISFIIIPILIQPMFNEFTDLKDKDLKQEILALAQTAGIEGSNVYEVDASKQSTKVNAYVTGLLNSKRIVLYDNLINNFTRDEIRFVMAHEMGHYVKNHIWVGFFITILFIIFTLWLTNLTINRLIERFKTSFKFDSLKSYASLPLVIIYLNVILFVFQPVINSISRYQERDCDLYGMEISGISGDVAASAFKKMSLLNLSDPDPHPVIEFWFYSHPSLNKRIEFVKSFN